VAVGAKSTSVVAGDLVAFWPGQDHELIDASPDLELFVMALRPELAHHVKSWCYLPAQASTRLDRATLIQISEQACALETLSDRLVVESSLVRMFDTLGRYLNSAQSLTRRAASEVQRRPALSASEIAYCLRSTPSDVSRRFKVDSGVRLVEFRARVRLMKFIRVVDSGQSLTSAALSADFGSYAQCHRVFQRVLGCSPREYFAGARATIDTTLAADV
jgi:AraC-like DNA-binding protein